jgi:C4-dicarboxylate-specific signal transduction histidine kinase
MQSGEGGSLAPSNGSDQTSYVLSTITKGAERVAQISSGLRAFVKQGQGEGPCELKINEIVRVSLQLADYFVKRHVNAVEAELDGDLPYIMGEDVLLQQMVVSLIVRVCLAVNLQNPCLKVRTCRGHIDGCVEVSICCQESDLVGGIDAAAAERLDSSLDLWVAGSIADRHGGEVVFRSVPGQGALALITLTSHSAQ